MFVLQMPVTSILTDDRLDKAAIILKAVAHPTRLKIVCLLGQTKKMSVNEICGKTGCEQSLVSHHLNSMRNRGILVLQREGKNIFYSLADRKILDVVRCINNCKNI